MLQFDDKMINKYLNNKNLDYMGMGKPNLCPDGLDTELFSFKALKKAWMEAKLTSEREHVTPYIYATHPEKFKITQVNSDELYESDIRLTLDTVEDYTLLCCIYDFLSVGFFDFEKIILLLKEKPYLKNINSNVIQKRVHEDLKDELIESINLLDLQELNRAKKVIEAYINENIDID